MTAERFEITYAAHTATCTFLLDGEGICRRIVMVPGSKRREASKNAARCIGAQYVATLDPTVPGCLVEMPKVGTPMLFARVDSSGRVALVRTGPITAFETKRVDDPDPFAESIGVMTSAPAAQELQTPRVRDHRSSQRPVDRVVERDPVTPRDPYIAEAERTQRIPAVGRNDAELEPHLLTTDEYDSDPATMQPRQTWPSAQPHAQGPGRTLHDPHVPLSPVDDQDDPYVENAYARTRQNRASEPLPKHAVGQVGHTPPQRQRRP